MATSIGLTTNTIRIRTTPTGEWSIETPDGESLGPYSTDSLAVARAWELAKGRPSTDLIIESATEILRCHLTIERADPLESQRKVYQDAEDERLSRVIERTLPTFDRLSARLDKIPVQDFDFSQEDEELPC